MTPKKRKQETRPRDRRMRGTPPPPTFSLAALPDDAIFETQIEVACGAAHVGAGGREGPLWQVRRPDLEIHRRLAALCCR